MSAVDNRKRRTVLEIELRVVGCSYAMFGYVVYIFFVSKSKTECMCVIMLRSVDNVIAVVGCVE